MTLKNLSDQIIAKCDLAAYFQTYNRPFNSFIKTVTFSTNCPSSWRKNIVETTVTPIFQTSNGIESLALNSLNFP